MSAGAPVVPLYRAELAAQPVPPRLDRVEFFVPGKPVAKGRPKFARRGPGVVAITPAKTREYEAGVASVAHAAMLRGGHAEPFAGALTLTVEVTVAPPVSWSAKRRAEACDGFIAPTKRPDLDNFIKAVLDGCDGVVWRDDSQVVGLDARKHFGEQPGVRVVVVQADVRPAP